MVLRLVYFFSVSDIVTDEFYVSPANLKKGGFVVCISIFALIMDGMKKNAVMGTL